MFARVKFSADRNTFPHIHVTLLQITHFLHMLNLYCWKSTFGVMLNCFCQKDMPSLHTWNFSAERTTLGGMLYYFCWNDEIFLLKEPLLGHVELFPQKEDLLPEMRSFLLLCWICWFMLNQASKKCAPFSCHVEYVEYVESFWTLCKVCPVHSAQKHSTYSTYSTWQQKEAHFLKALFNMIRHIQHDSWKTRFLNKTCFFQLSCWIMGGFSVGPGLVHQIDGIIFNIFVLLHRFGCMYMDSGFPLV